MRPSPSAPSVFVSMQRVTLGAVAGVALAAGSGCAVGGNVAQVTDTDALVTESVVTANRPTGVSEEDARVITDTVAGARAAGTIEPLAWSSPSTGASGTIVAIDAFLGKHGQSCRGFRTSMSTFAGIGFYDGETCQVDRGAWVLSWFRPKD